MNDSSNDPMRGFTADDIQALEGPEPIRGRPAMYIGPLERSDVCNCLIMEALCDCFDQIVSRHCTEAGIGITATELRVTYNGQGISMERRGAGRPAAELLMTELYACRDMKANQIIGEDICRSGIVVVNALSSKCSLDNFREGHHWRQTYTKGAPDAPFEELGETSRSGVDLRFSPDTELIPNPAFDSPSFLDWLTGLKVLSGQAVITVNDQASNQVSVLRIRDEKVTLERTE